MTNTQKIWDKLISAGMTKAGAAGLMGNLYAESVLNPKNLQNTYEKSLGCTDESYTAAVDNGTYTNFVKDCAGYGLAQWTFWTRKQALLTFAQKQSKSIGDLDMQLDFLISELKTSYSGVWKVLLSASDVKTASDFVMCQYERPADTSSLAKANRAALGQKYYDMFASGTVTATSKSISELAQEVISGKWGNSTERKEKLAAAGYDYDAVQAEVNKMLNQASDCISEPLSKEKKQVRISIDDKTYSGTLEEE